MPVTRKTTKRLQIPKHLNLLKKQIVRPCDDAYWRIHKGVCGRCSVVEFVKDQLIEREHQLFEYYKIEYKEIPNNEIHYLIRKLASMAGFRGFEYKKEPADIIGGWSGNFGTRFALWVLLERLKTNKTISQCIKKLIEKDNNYSAYKYSIDLSKRFSEIIKNNKNIKDLYVKNVKKLTNAERESYIERIEMYLTIF